MAKRTKENRIFWDNKINKLFKDHPKSQLTEYRWRAVRNVLLGSFPELGKMETERLMDILQTSDYVARKMRDKTQGKQKEIKRKLEQDFLRTL